MSKTAMILAAGFGTRLKPLTDNKPKALVEYQGTPLIEYVLLKLIENGFSNIVINTHYFAEQIERYIRDREFDAKINLIFEKEILGTGGAIKNAKDFLINSDSFLVHNVDVISDINFTELYSYHLSRKGLSTLAVQARETQRPLIIDVESNVSGRKENGIDVIYKKNVKGKLYRAFTGVSVLSNEIFYYFDDKEEFDIMPFYMSIIKRNIDVNTFDIGDKYWRDMGKIQNF